MTNFKDKTIWTGDNLDIMRGMNSAMFFLTGQEEVTQWDRI